jgi:hypothetical protein
MFPQPASITFQNRWFKSIESEVAVGDEGGIGSKFECWVAEDVESEAGMIHWDEPKEDWCVWCGWKYPLHHEKCPTGIKTNN